MKMFYRKDEGFTLVELMVVVLIIGILVAIAIPVFQSARANAERRSCHANQRTIEGACQTYFAGEEATPTAVTDLVTQDYLVDSPGCPDEDSTSNAAYTLAADGMTVTDCVDSGATDVHGHYTD